MPAAVEACETGAGGVCWAGLDANTLFGLPLFDWAVDPTEAKAAWEGFLGSPRAYQPLLLAFKPQFLETARHYGELVTPGAA